MRTRFLHLLLCLGVCIGAACLISCGDDKKEDTEWYVKTGSVTNITAFGATFSGSLNLIYLPVLFDTKIHVSDDKGNTWSIDAKSMSGSSFEVHADFLYPSGNFSYYASTTMSGMELRGDTKTFSTPSISLPTGAVDMGLSVRWAHCNVGASSAESSGHYWKWSSSFDNVRYYLAGSWRTPSYAEARELVDKCEWHGGYRNGVAGNYAIGPSGKIIFLPLAGYGGSGDIGRGYYMTSDRYGSYKLIYLMELYFGIPYMKSGNWDYSYTIRPVCD